MLHLLLLVLITAAGVDLRHALTRLCYHVMVLNRAFFSLMIDCDTIHDDHVIRIELPWHCLHVTVSYPATVHIVVAQWAP